MKPSGSRRRIRLIYVDTSFDVFAWAAEMAQTDKAACERAGTTFDTAWTGEHTSALADALGCLASQLLDEDVHAAMFAHASEAKKIGAIEARS